jgi:hypothetical protein
MKGILIIIKINNKNNESHFEITDKISEKEMGDKKGI